jgi:hypothetical protein
LGPTRVQKIGGPITLPRPGLIKISIIITLIDTAFAALSTRLYLEAVREEKRLKRGAAQQSY